MVLEVMYRRSRLDLYFDTLKAICRGADKPTKIMFKINSSWETTQEILGILLKGSFIKEEIVENSKKYEVTDKGKNALSYYFKSVNELFEIKNIIGR